MSQRKHCKSCDMPKELEEYHRAPTNRDGRTGRCKSCVNSRVRARRMTGSRREHGPILTQDAKREFLEERKRMAAEEERRQAELVHWYAVLARQTQEAMT